MKRTLQLAALATLIACQSSAPAIVDADPAQREALFSPIAALAGTWSSGTGEEATTTTFAVSSNGSAVRETMMVGTPHEMTNMYTLDGNSLVMVHYCAGGNQPRMRATAVDGDGMSFVADGVSDLKDADEAYMGSMTLVIVDENHIEQHWAALKNGEVDHENVIELTRVP